MAMFLVVLLIRLRLGLLLPVKLLRPRGRRGLRGLLSWKAFLLSFWLLVGGGGILGGLLVVVMLMSMVILMVLLGRGGRGLLLCLRLCALGMGASREYC